MTLLGRGINPSVGQLIDSVGKGQLYIQSLDLKYVFLH